MNSGLELKETVFGYRVRKTEKQVIAASGIIFHPGDFCILYGRNGSGKSTVLKTLAGLMLPLSGEILWNGEDWSSFSAERRAQTAAVVLTGFPVMGLFSAFETAALGRAPYTGRYGHLSTEDTAIVEEALNAVGVYSLKDRLFDSLSDGEKQKVMTARALAQQTPLLLLDEPTSFLDYESKRDFFRLLAECARKQGKIVIVSTHDLPYAEAETPLLFYCGEGTVCGKRYSSDDGFLLSSSLFPKPDPG